MPANHRDNYILIICLKVHDPELSTGWVNLKGSFFFFSSALSWLLVCSLEFQIRISSKPICIISFTNEFEPNCLQMYSVCMNRAATKCTCHLHQQQLICMLESHTINITVFLLLSSLHSYIIIDIKAIQQFSTNTLTITAVLYVTMDAYGQLLGHLHNK